MINSKLLRSLPAIKATSSPTKAHIIDLSEKSEVFSFLFSPQDLSYSAANNLSEKTPLFARSGYVGYQGSSNIQLNLNRCLFRSPNLNRSMTPITKKLELLRLPKKGKTELRKLSLVIGSRTIQPLFLQSYSVTETANSNGNILEMTVDFSFLATSELK